jgi:hypothetical protein
MISKQKVIGLSAGLMLSLAMTSPAGEAVSLFDGKTLDNWEGKASFWRVEDGAITGETTPDNPTKGNTFIIWKGGTLKDFDLTFEYRFLSEKGNSGCQYRSEHIGDYVVKGYQGDFEAGTKYSGILYGEKTGRGIMCDRGARTWLGDGKTKKKTERFADRMELQKNVKGKGEWNTFEIHAKGKHFTHKINGQLMSETFDESEKHFKAEGILAFQLHAGPPMKIQFRNIKLKTL